MSGDDPARSGGEHADLGAGKRGAPSTVEYANAEPVPAVGGRQKVPEYVVHAGRLSARQRQVNVAVAVDIGPQRAVISVQCAHVIRRDVLESRPGIAEQMIAIARAAGHRAVDVEVDAAVVVEV